MNNQLKSKLFNLSAAVFLLILAYIIQSFGLLGGDVACQLYNAKIVLAGGTYVKDFFETNPPLIFYLYMPVVLMGKLTSFNVASIFRVYVISLAAISILCSIKLLSQIFVKEESFKLKGFVFVLFFILLYLPGCEFGQREHLFLIFMLPYLFLTVLVVQNKKISRLFAGFIGLMAALGIGYKPYFLFPIVFVEVYLIFNKRHIFSWIRVESVTCIILLSFYLISVFLFDPEYIKTILPLVSHLYFNGVKESWSTTFSQASVLFCFFIWICFFVFKRKNQSELVTILMIGLTGMMAAFLVPRASWYYHVIPALGVACLLGWLYCYRIVAAQFKSIIPSRLDACIISIAAMYLFIIPLFICYYYTNKAIMRKDADGYHLLVSYIRSLPGPHRLNCFASNTTQNCFPLVQETQSQFAGKYPFYWWLVGLLRIEAKLDKKPLPPIIAKDKKYLIDTIAEDLNRYNNSLVIINVPDDVNKLGDNFSYFSYFSGNENFRAAWKHYHYVKTIGPFQVYLRS